ncbi:MAG: GyrI-like domain-containing protein [Candidatus Eisenbacteria bacterium]|nr:GyrI-like domain-containing protein [Candidatus Eisenbacteria bacterium]
MEPKIVKLPKMMLVGVVGAAPEVSMIDIASLWSRFAESSDRVAGAVEGAGYEFHEEVENSGVHLCLAGVQVSKMSETPLGMVARVLPASTYAVFTHRVADGYEATYERIEEWLEEADYAEAYPYDFQLYDSRFKGMGDPESELDIYVPVMKD